MSTQAPLRPRERHRPRSTKPAGTWLPGPGMLRRGLEAAALGLLLFAGVLGFGPSFGGDPRYLAAGLGGIILGLALAALAAARRWGTWTTAGAAGGTYLLLGSALAAPVEAAAGVLPTPASLRVLAQGLVFAWKDLLTVAPPVGTAGGMLVVPFLLSLLTALAAGLLAWRVRGAYWPALPVLALFAAGIAFGTKDAPLPGLRALLLAAGLLVFLSYRRARVQSAAAAPQAALSSAPAKAARLRRRIYGGAVIAAAAAVSLAAAPLLGTDLDRKVLRDTVEPPVDLFNFPSPLTDFRRYVKDNSDTTLFTVQGLPEGQRVRLAAMDAYDGVVYNVSGEAAGGFARVGDAGALGGGADNGTAAALRFEIRDYSGAWLPSGGEVHALSPGGDRAREIAAGLYHDAGTSTMLSTSGVRSGDSYEMAVSFPEEYDDAQLAQYGFAQTAMPRLQQDPPIIGAKAAEFAGEETTPIQRVRQLQQILATEGYFSNGKDGQTPSLPGHGAARMVGLLDAEQMVGDDEQYAVAMALMARKLGIPARVVMGFYPDWEELDGTPGRIDITGDDVHAWVEVEFERVGWVPFFPTPDEDNEPVPPQQQPKSTPKPQVLQPPPPPQEPAELPPDTAADPQDADEKDEDLWESVSGFLRILGLASLPLVVLFGPLLAILLLKRRLRTRRRTSGGTAQQVAGGWREVLGAAADLGVAVTGRRTRRQDAAALGRAFPSGAAATAALARRADAGVFGPGDPSEDEVRAYWEDVDKVRTSLTGTAGFWQRQRARYSLRSLRLESRLAARSPGALGRKAELSRRLRRTATKVTRRTGAAQDPQGPLG
ncbi:transglutaminase-like domain-containing protein [Arthrobacter koreensis]|uniref:transglutaminase-like domain-containing protein n=1 Tax=Arthrobacter koreensis TaxID=199136 RepID=UPI002DC02BA1|nr:transglutaminase-like domain-containing protein [Arthrobacter koreensis]MEB7505411.1 transglutaminase-like domain-containing protein [Arthrobacter koreensis]